MRLTESLLEQKPRVELIPLIDVMFLLLVFFIFAMLSMVVYRGIDLDLPNASTAQIETQPTFRITIQANGDVLFEGEPIALEAIAEAVHARLAAAEPRVKEPIVFVRGDRRADFGIAVELLDGLRRAGIEQVSFASVPDE